jgi:ABC-type sulfate transport system permease subunit
MESNVQVGGGSPLIGIIWLVVVVFLLVATWKVFTKAGKPGWASLIPIYNAYVMLVIAGKPGWWLVLMFIPVANLVVGILACIGLAERFGKGGGFAAGLILLPIVFVPILAFGSAKYQGAPAA